MMFKPCTATTPAVTPTSLCFQGDGNASIAATRTIVASTPLQPASIDTANPLVVERKILPAAVTPGSNPVTNMAETCASAPVHGSTNQRCTHGVSSSPNSSASKATNQMKKRIIAAF